MYYTQQFKLLFLINIILKSNAAAARKKGFKKGVEHDEVWSL